MTICSISTIIRIHSESCFPLLHRALFSLSGQLGEDIRIKALLLVQQESVDLEEAVREIASEYCFAAIKEFEILSLKVSEGEDARAKLLNYGLNKVRTRFVAFLDYDDVVYPNAYAVLTRSLKKGDAAISFGGITSNYFSMLAGSPYITTKWRQFHGSNRYQLFKDNFCPLHSYMIDLNKAPIDHLSFDESFTALEDYNFLLGFVAKYNSDFSACDTIIGEYYMRPGDTVQSAGRDFPDAGLRVSRLELARERIRDKKRSTFVPVRLSEFEWMLNPSSNLTPTVEKQVVLKEVPVVNFPIINSESLSTVNSLVFHAVSQIPLSETALIDNIFYDGSYIYIQGWVYDLGMENGPIKIVCAAKNGAFMIIADTMDRPDVRELYESDRLDHGFFFKISGTNRIINPGNTCVFAMNCHGDLIYQIPFHEKYLI